MSGSQDHRVGFAGPQSLDPDAVLVDRNGDDLQPRRTRDRHRVVARGGVLDGKAPRAAGRQRLDREGDTLGVAGADDDVRRLGRGAAYPIEVLGKGPAQLRHARAGGIAERIVRGVGECRPQRPHPRRAREVGDVGTSVPEVVAQRRGRRRRGRRGHGHRCDAGRHLGLASCPAHQVALGAQLLVGLHDDAAGDAQIGGQHAAGGQRRPSREPAGTDQAAQRRLDLAMQRDAASALERHQQR